MNVDPNQRRLSFGNSGGRGASRRLARDARGSDDLMETYGYGKPAPTKQSRSARAKQRNLRRGAASDEELDQEAGGPSADREMRDDEIAEGMDDEDEAISNSEIEEDE